MIKDGKIYCPRCGRDQSDKFELCNPHYIVCVCGAFVDINGLPYKFSEVVIPEEVNAKYYAPIDNSIGRKFDQGKLDWTLIPFSALEEVVKVLMYGETKYDRDNWQHVTPKARYVKASFRHLVAYVKGEQYDQETGITHLAHCVCCLLFLIWHDKNGSD